HEIAPDEVEEFHLFSRSADYQVCCVADFQIRRLSKDYTPPTWKSAIQQVWKPALRWQALSFQRCVAQLALVEINRSRRARRGVRIVRDHDDRLAVLAVER